MPTEFSGEYDSPSKGDLTSDTDSDSSCLPASIESQTSSFEYRQNGVKRLKREMRKTMVYPWLSHHSPQFLYSPQCVSSYHDESYKIISFKESFGRVTLTKQTPRKQNRFIIAILLMASISILLSSMIITIYSSTQEVIMESDVGIIEEILKENRNQDTFTIYLDIQHKRLDILKNSIDSHSSCPSVSQIIVHWNMDIDPPSSLLNNAKVVIARKAATFSTSAVFLLHDDLIFTCKELDRGFYTWKQHATQMVGFFPYHYQTKPKLFGKSFEILDTNETLNQYSILSDRASFVHRMYLGIFQNPPSPCNQIAVSIQITSVSSRPPILMAGKPLELQTSRTFRKIKLARHTKWLQSTNKCFSSMMENLGMKELPNETGTFIGGYSVN